MSTGAVIEQSALTPWFGGDVTPVRDGVYQRQITSDLAAFWRWNGAGKFWEYGGSPDLSGVRVSRLHSHDQDLPWRGLAADPAKEGV